ncbi:MAG: hypothetical protein EBV34_18570, partial [Betaproteobacteria bacterium]|nr:hypothetical protein [Betaproteobacteria bacterium]
MSPMQYPPWVVLHIPHDSTVIPAQVRDQFLLNDSALTLELQRMTDHFTNLLFAEPPGDAAVVRAPVSRLVVDVERFAVGVGQRGERGRVGERLAHDVGEVPLERRPQFGRRRLESELDPGGEVQIERLPLRLHRVD